MLWWLLVIFMLASYFLGNISFGKIIGRANKIDITKQGSGNPGATNVLRNVGAKMGFLTLFLDLLKGFAPAITAFYVFGGADGVFPDALIGMYACGLAAILGHVYPVIYKFKGGKGVATTVGVFCMFAGLHPIVFAIAIGVVLIVYLITKYVSLVSLLLISTLVVAQNLMLPQPNLSISLLTFAIFVLIWWAHRSNIVRLLVGKETETDIGKAIEKDKQRQRKKQEALLEKQVKRAAKQERKEEKKEEKEAKNK